MSWRDRAKQAVEKNRGDTPPTKPTKPTSVSFGSADPAPFSTEGVDVDWDYTPADLKEMDRLIRQLGELEGWSEQELAAKLDERRRMSPVNVQAALKRLGEANATAMAPWPDRPKERAVVRLCLLTGGKK